MEKRSPIPSAVSVLQRPSAASARDVLRIAYSQERPARAETSPTWNAARGAVLAAAAATVAAAAASAPPGNRVAVGTAHSGAAAVPRPAVSACPSVYGRTETAERNVSPGPAYFSDTYYRQLLLSFSSTKWFCPPPELSPFLLARNGFRCTDTGTIECAVCGEKWTAKRGLHSEIAPALSGAAQASASGAGGAALSPLATSASTSPPAAAVKKDAHEFSASPAAAGGGEGTGGEAAFEPHTAGTLATTAATTAPTAAVGAAGAAAARSVAEDARDAAERGKQTKQQEQHRRKEMEQQAKGGGTVERTLLLDKNTGLTSCASPETSEDSTRSDALEPVQGRKCCRTEEAQLEEEEEKAEYTVFMDAVALSFLHAECCPWRNSFIPLAAIHLEGAAVQPAALISQWTNRVQQLRRTAAAAGSPSQAGRYPCLTLQSARAFLLSALIAAAEAAAEAHARAGASLRSTAFGAKVASLQASPMQQAAGPSEAPEGGASNKEVTNAGGVQHEKEAGDTSKETSWCTHLLDASYFLSSPHSPLQDACVSHLSPREVQMLQQLWLILSKNDGASETLVRQYIPSGTVIPPVCASSLLLERKCALQEGSEKYKEADEYLSLPILDTLLQQVAALLFDPRVPLPGSPGPSSLLMSKNSLSDELSSAPFTFPKEHESVQVDCDKLLAFFGWGPVTDCTKSEQQRRSTAAEGDRQQQRQKTGATLDESDQSRPVPPQPEEHEIERPQPLQRAGAPAEQREPKSDQEQQNQSIGLNTVAVVSRSKDDGKLVAATAGEVTVDEQKSPAVLQCLYCFRRVDLRNYVSSAEDGCISSDSRWNVLTSERVGTLQKTPKIGAGNMPVEGWQQRTQVSDNEGTQRIELRKGSNRTETVGEEYASARAKDNGEQRQENAARKSTGAHSADSVATTVSCGGKSTGEGNNLASGYPCINVNVTVEVEERQNKDADNSKELERDTSVGGTLVHPQPPQATHILGTERTYRRRKREAAKTTLTSSTPSLDPVCTHRLHCPFVSNAVYKDKLPIVLRLFFSLLPVLIETLQLQVEKRRLEAEIKETWSFRKRCQRSERRGDD